MQKLEGVEIPLKEVNVIIGTKNVLDKPLRMFSDYVISFLVELSKNLFSHHQVKSYSDLVTFAFWCRKANLLRLIKKYDDIDMRMGRGICFHIAPSNVPMNFAFSMIFSLLAGNANIVRLPSKKFEQVDIFCQVLNKTLESYSKIRERLALIRYTKEESITSAFSLLADVRMIWGGNYSTLQIKKTPTKPRCVDLVFADRYSLSIIDGSSILLLTDKELRKLSENFYNDTFFLDQNACSSPQLICWTNDSVKARKRFWDSVLIVVKEKYNLLGSMVIEKYLKSLNDLIDDASVKFASRLSNYIYLTELSSLGLDIYKKRGNSGYFYEYSLEKLDKLFYIIDEAYQTVTYFGINPELIHQQIIEKKLKGIDRVVPIGKALDIDVFWDGYDLLRSLSRKISIS